MKNRTLQYTNLLIGFIIMIGFLLTAIVNYKFKSLQLLAVIAILVTTAVLFIITSVIRKYNSVILKLTTAQELEYQHLLREMTEDLYESIYEVDLTNNCAGGDSTREYFKSLGIFETTPYDRALLIIAKHIKEEYVNGYLDTFMPDALLEAYQKGITNLSYDMMISQDNQEYHWVRISARIFFWNSDKSIRMITYRKNIDEEKKRELRLIEELQKDPMTGLYNKLAMENLISSILQASGIRGQHAFLIFDIDNFKTVNDTMGHSFGDHVIKELACEIKTQFKGDDIAGRIGGDEFIVLMKEILSEENIKEKLERVCSRLNNKDFGNGQVFHISCSIGVAFAPKDGNTYTALYEKADQALYYAKGHGKASFAIFSELATGKAFHTSQRDIETLLNITTDGIEKFACTNPLTLLYFNEKTVELTETSTTVLSSEEYNPFSIIHQNDLQRVITTYQKAAQNKELFVTTFRMRHTNGDYFNVKMQGVFIKELYENKYPIFYALYLKLPTTEEK